MSSDILNVSPSGQAHAAKTHEIAPRKTLVTPSGSYNFQESQFFNLRNSEISAQNRPNSGIPSAAFASNSTLTFTLPWTEIHRMENMWLQLSVTNNNANSWSPAPGPALFSAIRVRMGDLQVENLQGWANYCEHIFHTYDRCLGGAAEEGLDFQANSDSIYLTSLKGAPDLPTTESRVIYVPIYSVLTPCNWPLGLARSAKVTLEIDIAYGSGATTQNPTQLPTLDDAQLFITGKRLADPDAAQLRKQYSSGPAHFKSLVSQTSFIPAGTPSAGTDYTTQLNQYGQLAYMFICQMAVTGNQFAPKALNSFELADNGSRTITGLSPVPADLALGCYSQQWFPGSCAGAQKLYIYPWAFSGNPRAAWETGMNYGYANVENTYQLTVNPSGAHNSNIIVCGRYLTVLTLTPDGTVYSSRSS